MQISLIKTYFFQVESFQPLQILASIRNQIENDNFKNSTFAYINFNINKLSLIIVILWLNNRKKLIFIWFSQRKIKIHQYKHKIFHSMPHAFLHDKTGIHEFHMHCLSSFSQNQEKSLKVTIFQFNLLSYICFIAPRFELQKVQPQIKKRLFLYSL